MTARFYISLVALLLGCMGSSSAQSARPIRVLLFSQTTTESSSNMGAIEAIGKKRGWDVHATRKTDSFATSRLRSYEVVVWLNSTGNVLNETQRGAYEAFHSSGKGTVVVHRGGADSEEDWPWYRKMVATELAPTSVAREMTLLNLDPNHPANVNLPWVWRQRGQWPNFVSDPKGVHVLLGLYDAMYSPKFLYPISWSREFDGGRYFFTALGGTAEDYASGSAFLKHLAGGIEWAAGRISAPVERLTDGDALILKEFDGVSPNGIWDKQAPSPEFAFDVQRASLTMQESSAISLHNRHLVRRGVLIDPKRPYAVEGKFSFPAKLVPNVPYSFGVNLNVAGADGDTSRVDSWSIAVGLIEGGRSAISVMGFCDGGFMRSGMLENNWGEGGVEYSFRIHVNADLERRPQAKAVSMVVQKGSAVLQKLQVDYSGFPCQPDETQPVRFGFNGHGPSWTLRDLKIYYLDVIADAQRR